MGARRHPTPFSFLGARLGVFAPWRLTLLPLVLAGCGYHSVYAAGPQGKLHVVVVRALVPDAVAVDEVASGVREELARAGALEDGEGYPRVEIEVLRAEENSEGVAAGASGPVARGTGVGVRARAWIAPSPGEQQDDTGDVRAEETVTVDAPAGTPDPRASTFHHADALRASARRLGRKLGARLLGQPAAGEE